MSETPHNPLASRPARSPAAPPAGPRVVPCLLMRRGQVCLPGPEGPVRISSGTGAAIDPFDILDRIREKYDRLYLVDLDGIERGDPQLEYIQEFSRDVDLWVDAGVPTAESAIDILVAGAQKAVLSSSWLRRPVELKRAWRLSTDWVFEVELVGRRASVASADWGKADPASLAEVAREVGIVEVVVSARGEDPDWELVRALASRGPTWVDGSFSLDDQPRLLETGAAGGIFHIDGMIADLVAPLTVPVPSVPPVSTRDDED